MPVVVRLHIIENNDVVVLAESIYKSGSLKEKMSSRGAVALKLLDDAKPLPRGGLLVAGTAYGSNRGFLRAVLDRRLNAIVEIRPSLQVELLTASGSSFSKEPIKAMKLLQGAALAHDERADAPAWQEHSLPGRRTRLDQGGD